MGKLQDDFNKLQVDYSELKQKVDEKQNPASATTTTTKVNVEEEEEPLEILINPPLRLDVAAFSTDNAAAAVP